MEPYWIIECRMQTAEDFDVATRYLRSIPLLGDWLIRTPDALEGAISFTTLDGQKKLMSGPTCREMDTDRLVFARMRGPEHRRLDVRSMFFETCFGQSPMTLDEVDAAAKDLHRELSTVVSNVDVKVYYEPDIF